MFRALILILLLSTVSADESAIRFHYSKALELPEGCVFIPPSGWLAADPTQFPENMLAMVVGKGKGPYPPSINIWIEPYTGSQKSYLKCIKETCLSERDEFRDLGQIPTESGNATLCQVDRKTKWGDERLLHALIVRYDKAYLLTAAAMKEEFADYYTQFFEAIRSMKINKSVFEQVASLDKRAKLQAQVLKLKQEAPTLSPEQNEKARESFIAFVDENYSDMGSGWKNFLLEKIGK